MGPPGPPGGTPRRDESNIRDATRRRTYVHEKKSGTKKETFVNRKVERKNNQWKRPAFCWFPFPSSHDASTVCTVWSDTLPLLVAYLLARCSLLKSLAHATCSRLTPQVPGRLLSFLLNPFLYPGKWKRNRTCGIVSFNEGWNLHLEGWIPAS